MEKGNILAVDDTPESLKLVTGILKAQGYKVRPSVSGEMALPAAALSPPDLVLLDVHMPGMDGYEVCRRLKQCPETRDIPVIFVSAHSETFEKVKGFEAGAVDYVTKPFHQEELLARVRTHLELYRLRHRLEYEVRQRTAALAASEKRIRDILVDSIAALASTVEVRDPYTAGHQRRTAQIAVAIARELGLPDDQTEGIYLAGVVHDVGKIRVPLEILNKPGRLTDLEFLLIKEHVRAGYEILKGIDYPWPIAEVILQHHERLDGSGYPQSLKGDQILREAKILAVADVVEAMTSHRPYRAGRGIEAALTEIRRSRGKFYDVAATDACLRLFEEQHWGDNFLKAADHEDYF